MCIGFLILNGILTKVEVLFCRNNSVKELGDIV